MGDIKDCSCSFPLYRNNDDGTVDIKRGGKLNCLKCRGYGSIETCPTCEGAGMVPSSQKCSSCWGTGFVPVKTL